jgi:hypothetical protein
LGVQVGQVLRLSVFTFVAAVSGLPTPAYAGPARNPSPAARAGNAASASKIDSAPNDGAWERAPAITGFVQRDPKEGAAPSFPTEARVLYDREYLYVKVRAFDTDAARIVGIRTRRDSDSPSDWIRIIVDSYCDHKTAYEFAVNPAGVKRDTYWFADSNSDTSWDAVWDVSVTRDEKGWTAAFRIPFSQLRFRPGGDNVFGFAVVRQIGRLNEMSSWPLIKKGVPGYVSQFGELTGLELTGAAKRLEVSPYTVGKVMAQPLEAGNPFVKPRDAGATVGADLKYAVTPGLTLTSTINPDFGQVEADPAVVNLTAFETFYQERRPFFVEGSGNLRFDLDCNDGRCTGLFYSRRIGRTPHGDPVTPDGGFAYSPAQTTILGAGKLTGRAGAFAIGALDALASNETASLALGTNRWQQTVEPLTNYALFQAKREWSDQSSLGFLLTNTARRIDANTNSLPSNATTGGVNWDWRFPGRRYSLTGYWAGSTLRGSAAAIDDLQRNAVHNCQRPDQSYIDCDPASTSLGGHAGMVNFQKIGGERVRFSFNGGYKTPGFDVNDVGYLQRADTVEQSGWVQIRWDKPTAVYRNVRLNFNQWSGWNFGGDRRFTGANVNAHITLVSNWMAGVGVNYQAAGIDDRSSRGGPAFRNKRGGNVWYYVQSDERKRLNGMWQAFHFRDEAGATDWGFDPQVTYRPASFLSISGGVHFEKMNEDTQWVENVEDASTHYVFGRLRQTTLGLTGRLNYTITPTLTVQLYAQPFVSAGAYGDFKELVRPRVTPFGNQFDPCTYAGNPDFNYRSFRMTNVLRWEYRPGSALYVVWQQGREDTASEGRFRYGNDLASMFGTPGINVFLVKLSYWLNL